VTSRGKTAGGLGGYVTLFASMGTLVCCALPALLVVLGLGTTVASLLSALPWLVSLSRHKEWVFAATGVLIAASSWYQFRLAPHLRSRAPGCPPGDEAACARATRVGRVLVWASLAIYAAGFSIAYLLGPLLTVLDR